MTSLLELQEAWQKHHKFKNRALGGRRALDGFHYQFAVSLGIAQAGRAALALNLYGLKAPEALFKAHRAELAQLVNEQIWRLAYPGTGSLGGRFFHPQISRLIYEVYVPRAELVRRAEDIARGFDSMLDEGEPADAFLGWLGSGKIGKARTWGALILDEAMRIEILKAIWPSFSSRIHIQDIITRLFRWHQAALRAGFDLKILGANGPSFGGR